MCKQTRELQRLSSNEMSMEAMLMRKYHDRELQNFLKLSENLVPLKISMEFETIYIVLLLLMVKMGS